MLGEDSGVEGKGSAPQGPGAHHPARVQEQLLPLPIYQAWAFVLPRKVGPQAWNPGPTL